MPNRLADEKSLYLRQHANNPVDWWPWCEQAWEEARRLNKPVLVSIGYSSCHWCHVMARESFSSDYIASLMNRHFVCIKVDREERPDIDQLFMESVQMITGQGGWPLNAFCLPDGRPFFGGTYFPPEDRNLNLIPWPQLIMRISDYYRKGYEELVDNAQSIFGNLTHSNAPLATQQGVSENLNHRDLISAAQSLCSQYDVQNGGFGGAPKFPPSLSLGFLEAVRSSAAADADAQLSGQLDIVLPGTLTAMARGGIYDQIGGGFTRYSVDAHWEIPHFEKMLYDNALLIGAYVKGYQRYRDPLYLSIIEETIGWLDAQMRSATVPAYFAAMDAESEGKEGIYYLWNPQQVAAVLGEADAERFCRAYGIGEQGNFENTGLSNPIWHGKEHALRVELEPLRRNLLAARRERKSPGIDTKILTGWNALLATSLAEAGFWLNRADWLQKARELTDWLWSTLTFTREDGTTGLYAVYYEDGGARIEAFLDDYAALAQACFTLAGKVAVLEADAHGVYIERGNALLHTVRARFADTETPGWFFTAADKSTPESDWSSTCAPHAAACSSTEAEDDSANSGGCCGGHSHDDDHGHEGGGCCGGGHGHHHHHHDDAADEDSGCCGGGGKSGGGCGCSHSHEQPEAVPFTEPAPGQTLLRKKYWLDNATPAGSSQLLHALGAQQALAEADTASTAATTLARIRPSYSGLSARAPGGIAHALAAFTEQAIGLVSVKTGGGQAQATDLRDCLATGPWRNVAILAGKSTGITGSGYQLCVGTQCLPTESSAEAVASQI